MAIASMQLAYHYVGTGRAIAAYVPLRRRHGGTRLAPTRAPVIRSAARRHADTPTCPQRQTASPWGAFAPQAADRLVHRRRTPHCCGTTRPRISTAYAPCGETRQTTYNYDERTITYTKGRVAGPSVVTLRNCYTFAILRTAGRTAGTRLAIRPGHEREQQTTGRTTNQGSYDHEPYHEAQS